MGEDLIKTGYVCRYCGGATVASIIKKVRRDDKAVRICWDCDAWVGCHEETGVPFGMVAKEDLRRARILAHEYFDPIFKSGLVKILMPGFIKDTSWRQKSYIWLASQLSIPVDECHIGMFDIDFCVKTAAICNFEMKRFLLHNQNPHNKTTNKPANNRPRPKRGKRSGKLRS